MSDDFTGAASELVLLRPQLAEVGENWWLIQERMSEYEGRTDMPLQLYEKERELRDHYWVLQQRVERLERILLPTIRTATILGLGTHPFGSAGDRWRNPRDGKEMVRVPAGKFLYGDDKKEAELLGFWIDKAPVTNAEYARFVAETGHKPPKHWKGKTPPKEIADHPVVYVSWHDAAAYATWAGGRLPTEEQWEKAARGTDGRVYPWGDEPPDEGRCSLGGKVPSTTPVGQYSPHGDSPYGCVDMAGNIGEWTATQPDPRSRERVVRKGAWSQRSARCARRSTRIPVYFSSLVGLRVVVSLALPPSDF